MSTEFDPYHRWLGIRPEEQPADHYRLLGLVRFEDDPEAILDAAERQIAHVRRYALGQHQALSQKILNELATAKVCLLNPDKKQLYDATLRQAEASAVESRQSPPTVGPDRQEAEHTAASASEPPAVGEGNAAAAGPSAVETPPSENPADWDPSLVGALMAVGPAQPAAPWGSGGKPARGKAAPKTRGLPIPPNVLLVLGVAAGVLVLVAVLRGVFAGGKKGGAEKDRVAIHPVRLLSPADGRRSALLPGAVWVYNSDIRCG